MLGPLELMASHGATTDQMFEATKYIHAFWFPQQTLEIAIYIQANDWVDFTVADLREVGEVAFFYFGFQSGLCSTIGRRFIETSYESGWRLLKLMWQ